MESYIDSLPEVVKKITDETKYVLIVMGNEAVDLDSAVSAIVFAHHLSKQRPDDIVIPMLNVPREELPLKTEVLYCINQKSGLDANNIPCRDEVSFDKLNNFGLVLVDHHALTGSDVKYQNKVVKIIDHHVSKEAIENSRIELVGSCTSLVMDSIWTQDESYKDPISLNLVRYTIIVDTVNLSEEAKKVTPTDLRILQKIEKLLNLSTDDRTTIFEEISRVKADISSLTVGQLLRKDLKVVEVRPDLKVAMSSVMMSANEMSKRENFVEELKSFLAAKDCSLSVIMGAEVSLEKNDLKRDIVIYPVAPDSVGQSLVDKMSEKEDLELTRVDVTTQDMVLFQQRNVAFSRKFWLPTIRDLLKDESM